MRFFLSYVLNHRLVDHGMRVGGSSVGHGYGSFRGSINYHMGMRHGLNFVCSSIWDYAWYGFEATYSNSRIWIMHLGFPPAITPVSRSKTRYFTFCMFSIITQGTTVRVQVVRVWVVDIDHLE